MREDTLFVTNLTLERYNYLLDLEKTYTTTLEKLKCDFENKKAFLQPQIEISLSNCGYVHFKKIFKLQEGLLTDEQLAEIKEIFESVNNNIEHLLSKIFPTEEDKFDNLKINSFTNIWKKILNFISDKFK